MTRWSEMDWRLLTRLSAVVLLVIASSRPSITLPRPVYRLLFVVDITQSMNVRDYTMDGQPTDRLQFAKTAIHNALATLPCGSVAGLAIFTEKNVQLLLTPLEVCKHFTVLADSVAHLNWRMAWAADSYIARGLYNGLQETARLGKDAGLVFLTDGQEQTPRPDQPPLAAHSKQSPGILIGVGGLQPAPVPRYDEQNRQTSYWSQRDIAAITPGATPNTDPQALYQSALDEAHLLALARTTGLGYARLEQLEDLRTALHRGNLAKWRWQRGEGGWLFAVLAGLALLGTGPGAALARRYRMRSNEQLGA